MIGQRDWKANNAYHTLSMQDLVKHPQRLSHMNSNRDHPEKQYFSMLIFRMVKAESMEK